MSVPCRVKPTNEFKNREEKKTQPPHFVTVEKFIIYRIEHREERKGELHNELFLKIFNFNNVKFQDELSN